MSRKFNTITDQQLSDFKTKSIKKHSRAIMLGVHAYKKWRMNKLDDITNFDAKIFEANLDLLPTLTKENLEYALVRFVPEVTKVNGGGEYRGKTLYEMCVAIQKIVNENGKP